VLLYTTGLRLGELVRLKLGDYDQREHTLLIRDSKFHKSRLMPLSIDGTREIDEYLAARRSQQIAVLPESPLLWHHTRRGSAYTGTGLTRAIRPLLRALQIRTETGRLPRVHDFRHTFALEALLRWYRNGADVQAKLPLLATYMGHVSIASTEYYLKFVEPLGVCASERFAKHCASLLSTQVNAEGGQ
jgi:integrase